MLSPIKVWFLYATPPALYPYLPAVSSPRYTGLSLLVCASGSKAHDDFVPLNRLLFDFIIQHIFMEHMFSLCWTLFCIPEHGGEQDKVPALMKLYRERQSKRERERGDSSY